MSSSPSRADKIGSLLKIALGLVSALGVLMMFFGFGTALALDGFGVDVHQVLHGPADYLAAASFVVMEIFVRAADLLIASAWWGPLLIWTAFIAGGSLVAFLLISNTERLHTSVVVVAKKTCVKIGLWFQHHIHCWRPPAIVASIAAGGSLIGVLPYLIGAPLVLTVLPFFIGLKQANQYFYETVSEPVQCKPLMPANARRASYVTAQAGKHVKAPAQRPYWATCLKVMSKDGNPIFGRRVIATSDSVVLFDPETGGVDVVPTRDAVVSLVEKLPAPQKSAVAVRR